MVLLDYRMRASLKLFASGAITLWLAATFVSLVPNPLDWSEAGRASFVAMFPVIAWLSSYPIAFWPARTEEAE